jgi:hypothetical protein
MRNSLHAMCTASFVIGTLMTKVNRCVAVNFTAPFPNTFVLRHTVELVRSARDCANRDR